MPGLRSWPGREIPAGYSTFGAPLTAADEFDLSDQLRAATAAADALVGLPTMEQTATQVQADIDIALASRRWIQNDDGHLLQTDTRFVAGDVVAMRSSATRFLAQAIDLDDPDASKKPSVVHRARRAATLNVLTYGATPYWLDRPVAWAAMASKALTDEDRAELLLPGPALVLLSSGMEITSPYLGIDLRVIDCWAETADARFDPEGVSDDARDHAPWDLRSGTLGVLRYWRDLQNGVPPDELLFRYQLMGVLLCPNVDGTLASPVAWLLRRIDPNAGATTRSIVQGDGLGGATTTSATFTMVEGNLERSFLRPIAESLAALVAWGSWTRPEPFDLSEGTTGKAFRKLSRTSAFKKAEERGQVGGVRVLDASARHAALRYTTTGDGRTVRTHYRRGHWRRVRVGPKDNWVYQRQRISPVIVNAGQDPIEDLITVYRLPPPAEE